MEPADYILGLSHVGIVTEDLDAHVARLGAIFAVPVGEVTRVENSNARFAFFSVGGTPYEVIEPVSDKSRSTLLKTNVGVNHVCYEVTDIESAVAAMRGKGVRLGHVTPDGIVDSPHFRMAYFNADDCAGVLLEFKEFLQS
ncbi:MAG: VOC family protein [Congregibacter sp.]